eukprot:363897-Chlamydomonas_euryale.AAC.6
MALASLRASPRPAAGSAGFTLGGSNPASRGATLATPGRYRQSGLPSGRAASAAARSVASRALPQEYAEKLQGTKVLVAGATGGTGRCALIPGVGGMQPHIRSMSGVRGGLCGGQNLSSVRAEPLWVLCEPQEPKEPYKSYEPCLGVWAGANGAGMCTSGWCSELLAACTEVRGTGMHVWLLTRRMLVALRRQVVEVLQELGVPVRALVRDEVKAVCLCADLEEGQGGG